MLEYQERVTHERADLDEKRAKLNSFIDGKTFEALDAAEQDRLRRQQDAMSVYSEVLGERIAAFRN